MKRRALILALALITVLALSVSVAFAARVVPAPTVSITAPANGVTVSGTSVAISANCASGGTNYTVSGATYSIDGGSAVAMTGPNGAASGTWTANWNSTAVGDGSHIIAVTATNSGRKTTTASVTVTVSNGGGTGNAYTLIAYNDLGMHCACPNEDQMIMLPPYNTIRAQLIKRGIGGRPANITSGVTLSYVSNENNEANLLQDAEYLKWLDNAQTYYPGSGISRTNIVGLTGNKLNGNMKVDGNNWLADGIPNYPAIDSNGIYDFFGQKRNPYLTATVTAKDTTGKVLAQTTTVVPVSFGGCCNCHYKLAQNVLGKPAPTQDEAFKVMCDAHLRDTGVNIYAMKPVRCGNCHADPAGGTTTNKNCTTTFSEALHLFHANSALVKSTYSANIDNDCYQCHPDATNVKCYRGVHQNKAFNASCNLWCSDCHGTILARKDRTDYTKPWNYASLPKCGTCHPNKESARSAPIFGLFLNSIGHKGVIDCLTCHGSPHAELPSTMSKDNAQAIRLQNDSRPIGVCDVCHDGKSTTWAQPPH